MPIDPDPRTHITSSTDFYALLNVSSDFSGPDVIRRAYRKGSLKYHPDKAVKPGASEAEKEAVREKWDLFEVARKLLEEPSLRSQYDSTRAAREQKRKREAAHDDSRRKMLERLEKREGGVKRDAAEMLGGIVDQEEKEKRRLASEGAKAREALMVKRRAEAQDREEELSRSASPVPATSYGTLSKTPTQRVANGSEVREEEGKPVLPEERTVKIRFPADSAASFNVSSLEQLFSSFGVVDSVAMGQVKDERLGPGREKRPLGRGYVQFKTKIGAYDAVFDWKEERERVNGQGWEGIEDVTWLTKNPPTWVEGEKSSRSRSGTPTTTAPSTPWRPSKNPRDFLTSPIGSTASTPVGKLRSVPSFGSFKSAKK